MIQIILFFAFALLAKDLFYIELIDGDYDGFLGDAALGAIVHIVDKKEKAKPFYVSQDPKDEYTVKLHAHVGGEDVLSVRKDDNLVFMRESKEKDDEQYFTIKKTKAKKIDNMDVYMFAYKDKWITYDKSRIYLKAKNEDYNNQKFRFVSTNNNPDAKPITFSDEVAEPKKDEPEPCSKCPQDYLGTEHDHDVCACERALIEYKKIVEDQRRAMELGRAYNGPPV